MFGGAPPSEPNLLAWLQMLRAAEPATRRGELVHRNLLEDGNVGDSARDRLRDFLEDRPVASAEQAVRLYEELLAEHKVRAPACSSPQNQHNRIASLGFPQLVRVVDGHAFVKYNFYGTNKRKIPRRHRSRPPVTSKIRIKELQKKGILIENLRGTIGGEAVFATSGQILEDYRASRAGADDLRDRLGLDDPGRFGKGGFMVAYVYAADLVPEQRFYRPTVLDAGWCSCAAAFLPSAVGTAQAGWTQHLVEGTPAEPEVLHPAIPAQRVAGIEVMGPLQADPPVGYKSLRLASAR